MVKTYLALIVLLITLWASAAHSSSHVPTEGQGAQSQLAPNSGEAAVLLVIDMQPAFSAANDAYLLKQVAHEVILARKRLDPIIFLEYQGFGKTHAALRALVEGYPHAYVRKKDANDGSGAVNACLARFKIEREVVRICGVNTDACVYDTVVGLHDRVLKKRSLQVLPRACHSHYYHTAALKWMQRLERVRVMPNTAQTDDSALFSASALAP